MEIPFTNQLVMATNCLYRDYHVLSKNKQRDSSDTDGTRGDLAAELFTKTSSLGIRIVVCDGGSSYEFLSAVDKFTGNGLTIVSSDTPGRGPQRRSAFKAATLLPGSRIILYTQPEKVLDPKVISQKNYFELVSKPILEGRADIVIPKRNHKLFEQSYPPYMRLSELKVNRTYDRLMHGAKLMREDESFDWFFGQVVFINEPEIVALFLKEYVLSGPIRSRIGASPNPQMHSAGHYFPIIEALFNRLRVVSVDVPFEYPATQRANEESSERMAEFKERRLLDGAAYRLEALHFLAFLQGDPRSKIIEIGVA